MKTEHNNDGQMPNP